MNLKKITYSNLLLFLLIACSSALILAYISQYIFGFEPCILCLYQRAPFWIIIILATIILLIPQLKKLQKSAIIFITLLLLSNGFLALYHFGVEKKIFVGPSSCSNISTEPTNLNELKEFLAKHKAVRCDQPSFIFLGISMAGWNVFYCLSLVISSLYGLKLIRLNQQ